MKRVLIKIPAMLAMILSILSFYNYALSFTDTEQEVWILSVILAVLCIPFYFTDAIISFVKAIRNRDRVFNFILAAVLIIFLPMVIVFASVSTHIENIFYNVVWNIYYIAVFVLEVVSIIRCAKNKQ